MRRDCPLTWQYLKKFESFLKDRSSSSIRRLMESGPFYSMFAVGPYTLGRHKVVWREQSGAFQAAVVGPDEHNRRVVPDHKLMLVDFDNRPAEAHYVCALLNSAPSIALVGAYVVSTSTSTHVLEHVRIPKYDAKVPLHRRLGELSQKAHAAAGQGKADLLSEVEAEIDQAAGKLWGISSRNLRAIVEFVRAQEPRPLLDAQGEPE